MATFVNSFFLSQTYSFWVATKGNARKVQGRLNDLGMLLATHATRDAQGNFTPASRELLATVAGWVRLYHVLFWAAHVRPARADEGLSLSVFRTEIGLEALEKRRALLARLLTIDVLLSEGATVDDVKRGVADVVSAYGPSDSPTKSCPLDSFISCLDQPVYISLQHVDVTLVASQAGVTRGVAREALIQNDLDIVNAILGLTM